MKKPARGGLGGVGMSWWLAVLLKPFATLLFFAVFCLPARLAVQRLMPEGKLKRLLLTPLRGKQARHR